MIAATCVATASEVTILRHSILVCPYNYAEEKLKYLGMNMLKVKG